MNFKKILILLFLISTISLNAQEIFRIVEEMPRFYSEKCEALDDSKKAKECAQFEMLRFISSNIKAPKKARKGKVRGTVVVRFVVWKDGSIRDAKIVRDIGEGCGEEALRVVNSMPNWVPGIQRGRHVPVYFNLPFKYAYNKKTKRKKRTKTK